MEKSLVPYKNPQVKKTTQKGYSKAYYQRNIALVKKRNAVRKAKQRQLWIKFKSQQSCKHCGAKHIAIIDFHHVIRENKRSVNLLAMKQNKVGEAIKEATEKCIPLCSNCHRILHWKEHKKLTRARQRKRLKK